MMWLHLKSCVLCSKAQTQWVTLRLGSARRDINHPLTKEAKARIAPQLRETLKPDSGVRKGKGQQARGKNDLKDFP